MGEPPKDDDLDWTKRVMARLVRMPPKPHKDKGEGQPTGKNGESLAKPAPQRAPAKRRRDEG